ncbi:hypothetical protein, partial [Kitasatospora sp. NE20-6]|uniref:hypothetical protein n=1 Tax=Kitasatospora sp. NE20-6 TaxID=2859066 RepID=UPI0038B3AF79
VEFARAWAPEWDAGELRYLKERLAAKFAPEALVNHADVLLQPGGLKDRMHRPVQGGTEIITVQVTAVRLDQNPTTGRTESAVLNLMPVSFASASGADTLATSLALSGGLSAVVGVGNRTGNSLRTLGPSLGLSAAADWSAGTGVNSSGFHLHGVLYSGPARTFDYRIAYQVKVSIKHVAGPASFADWPKIAANRIAGIVTRQTQEADRSTRNSLVTGARAELTYRIGDREDDDHRVRLVVPEPLTADTPYTAGTAGSMHTHPYAVPESSSADGEDQHMVVLPDLPQDLRDAHTPLDAEDVVMETIGSRHVEAELLRLLAQVGIGADAAGDITWTLTDPGLLLGAHIRVPSGLRATMIKQGLVRDRSALVRIEAFPIGTRTTGRTLSTLRIELIEGGTGVSGTRGSGRSRSFTTGMALGVQTDASSQAVFPGVGYQRTTRSTGSRTTVLGPIAGRQAVREEEFEEFGADLLYRVTVVGQAKNMVSSSAPKVAASLFHIADGIRYLRPTHGPADPHDPALRTAVRPAPNRPTLLRRDTPPSPGPGGMPVHRPGSDRVVTTLPATPEDRTAETEGRVHRRLGTRPLIPLGAVSERLLIRPGEPGAPGDGNPVLDAVQRVLQEAAPGALEEFWQVNGAGRQFRPMPSRLANLLSLKSMEALLDVLLGPGLVLHATRSGPLHHERFELRLRAQRDPDSKGYYFLESLREVTASSYHIRSNKEDVGASRARSRGWSVSGRTTGTLSADAADGRLDTVAAVSTASASASAATARSKGGSDVSRTQFNLSGPADRYAGELRIDVDVVRAVVPSRLVNTVGLTLPDKASLTLGGRLEQERIDGQVSVKLTERVLVPAVLQGPALEPYVPTAGDVAVREIPFGSAVGELGRPLQLRGPQVMDRQVIGAGFDHEKLRVLVDELVRRLAGGSAAVARMVSRGSRARDALFALLSQPMLTSELDFLVDEGGLVSPVLVREGGLFTDTHARVRISVEPFDAKADRFVEGDLDADSLRFTESNQTRSSSTGLGLGTSLIATATSGSLDAGLQPGSPAAQNPVATLSLTLDQNSGATGSAGHWDMVRMTSTNRKTSWLWITTDVLLRIEVEARNQRGLLDLPGGTARMAFHVRSGLEVVLAPEAALDLLDAREVFAHGVPTPSGFFVPVKGVAGFADDGAVQLRAAFGFPVVGNAVVVHVHTDGGGRFLVGNRALG